MCRVCHSPGTRTLRAGGFGSCRKLNMKLKVSAALLVPRCLTVRFQIDSYESFNGGSFLCVSLPFQVR